MSPSSLRPASIPLSLSLIPPFTIPPHSLTPTQPPPTPQKGIADGARASVIGGSHGGFLTGHLVGQFPARWRCAGLRNPVLNIALMVGITDIPDWCYVETFGTEVGARGLFDGGGGEGGDPGGRGTLFLARELLPPWFSACVCSLSQLHDHQHNRTKPNPNQPNPQEGRRRYRPDPTAADLAAFAAASPIAHVHNVTAPLAFMLGAKDRRVPLEDGRRYIDAVKAMGVPTRVLTFPNDTHALDKPQTEFEQWLNLAWWLRRYMDGGGEGEGVAAS